MQSTGLLELARVPTARCESKTVRNNASGEVRSKAAVRFSSGMSTHSDESGHLREVFPVDLRGGPRPCLSELSTTRSADLTGPDLCMIRSTMDWGVELATADDRAGQTGKRRTPVSGWSPTPCDGVGTGGDASPGSTLP